MITSLAGTIIAWIKALGFMGVFYASVAEEIIHVVPTSVVHLTAGAMLLGDLSWSWQLLVRAILFVGIPAALGVTIGALPFYIAGWYGGKPFIERYGKWIGVSWESIEAFDRRLSKTAWDEVIYTILRAMPFIPSIVMSVGAGVLRLPLRTYFIGSLLGTFIRATAMGMVGALLGSQAGVIGGVIKKTQNAGIIFLVILVTIVGYYLHRRIWTKKTSRNA